ncbi:MAG: S1C family serine protease [Candidatus Omnitrophica bacterium]|nr:S1C family serine protease [Candidatus Omnitrophota bacterium]MDD5487499.1 S1C family serine protease [Candidatus Omnitrophota bacterium]
MQNRSAQIIIRLFLAALIFGVMTKSSYPLGMSSIIDTIQRSLDAIVFVKAENAIVGDSADGQGVKLARFERKGAGIIASPAGLIITNAHIVNNASRVLVAVRTSSVYNARVLWVSQDKDIAFIKIDTPGPLPVMTLSDSDATRLGDKVYTVGSSALFSGTIQQGLITGIGARTAPDNGSGKHISILQTDLSLHRGDSGGPLIDSNGNILGLLFAGRTDISGKSYAIPSNIIMKEFEKLLASQK